MHGSKLRLRFVLRVAAVALICPAVAQAAGTGGEIETVLVSARKTTENLQLLPGSATVLSGAALRSAGLDDFRDLAEAIPNVAISGGIAGALQGQVGIRGISTLVRNIGAEAGVGFFIDGVYQGRPENYDQELIDVARVEVLRGPQATIFGKNTIAGAFNVTTVRPDMDAVHAAMNTEIGNYGLARLQGYVTGPLIDDRLAGKLSLGYVRRDGVYRHLSGGPDGDSLDLLSYRSSLYFTPSARSEFVLTVDGLHDTGNAAFFQVTGLLGATSPHIRTQERTPLTIDNNRPDYLHRDNMGMSLTATGRFGAGTLTSITAYRQSRYAASLDDDQNQIDYAAADRWGDRNRFWSEELRFNGMTGSDLDYVAGFYYLGQTLFTDRGIAAGPDLGFPDFPWLLTRGSVRSRDYSLYGNLNYHISDALTASFGLRLSKEDKDADFTQADPSGMYAYIGYPNIAYARSVSNSNISPTAALTYRFTPDIMGYGRIARGFKSAAFNIDIVHSANGLAADPENATSYEIGFKSELFGRRARLNGAIFRTDYNDMQVSQLLGTAVFLSNAASAGIDGAELEASAFLTPGLRIDIGIGALDARYDRFEDCSAPVSLGGQAADCSGNRIVGAPDWTLNVAAEYETQTPYGRFAARLDYRFQSPVYSDATNAKRFESDSRNIAGARVGLTRGSYGLTLWVRNLFDERYVTYADDRSALMVSRTTAYGEPRSFGATFSVTY